MFARDKGHVERVHFVAWAGSDDGREIGVREGLSCHLEDASG
jgi:hypothetical protein